MSWYCPGLQFLLSWSISTVTQEFTNLLSKVPSFHISYSLLCFLDEQLQSTWKDLSDFLHDWGSSFLLFICSVPRNVLASHITLQVMRFKCRIPFIMPHRFRGAVLWITDPPAKIQYLCLSMNSSFACLQLRPLLPKAFWLSRHGHHLEHPDQTSLHLSPRDGDKC